MMKGRRTLLALGLPASACSDSPTAPSTVDQDLTRVRSATSPPRAPGPPWQYELQVCTWRDNPAGRFAPFNPAVSC